MESNIHYTVVGIFVLTLITFIILGIIWLSSGISIEHYAIYKVYMNESVNGLNVDAPVQFNGVNVGSVKSIGINHQDPRLVELLLNIKKNTPITVGTRAKLEIKSLSGIASIELVDKGVNLTLLRKEQGEEYPVIRTTPSLLVHLEGLVTKFGDNFNQISQAIQALLTKKNIQLMQETLAAGKETLAAGKEAFRSGKNTLKMFDTRIIPDANRAIRNFETMTRDFSALLNEIKENPAVLIRGRKEAPLGPGEK